MNILVEYPKNKKLKFLFTSYPTQELTGRDRVVKEELRLPFEKKSDVFLVVETDLSDLPESLQRLLRTNLKMDDSDTLVYRAFSEELNNSLVAENNVDLYNLVYSNFEWDKSVKNKTLN